MPIRFYEIKHFLKLLPPIKLQHQYILNFYIQTKKLPIEFSDPISNEYEIILHK